MNFSSNCFLSSFEEINSIFSSFEKMRNIAVLIFCYLIADSQLKWGIICKKISIQASDDERIISYECSHCL